MLSSHMDFQLEVHKSLPVVRVVSFSHWLFLPLCVILFSWNSYSSLGDTLCSNLSLRYRSIICMWVARSLVLLLTWFARAMIRSSCTGQVVRAQSSEWSILNITDQFNNICECSFAEGSFSTRSNATSTRVSFSLWPTRSRYLCTSSQSSPRSLLLRHPIHLWPALFGFLRCSRSGRVYFQFFLKAH